MQLLGPLHYPVSSSLHLLQWICCYKDLLMDSVCSLCICVCVCARVFKNAECVHTRTFSLCECECKSGASGYLIPLLCNLMDTQLFSAKTLSWVSLAWFPSQFETNLLKVCKKEKEKKRNANLVRFHQVVGAEQKRTTP